MSLVFKNRKIPRIPRKMSPLTPLAPGNREGPVLRFHPSFPMQSIKLTSKNNSSSSSFRASSPPTSRRCSMEYSVHSPKSIEQIREEMMRIDMSKYILVHPSQPFGL
ncbi:hypothetical protein BGX26_005839 [Mortierella sp. AD094]|nr:hypothetical protein BGX26_005839 [Mortierella sp. AD094]